MSRRPLVAAAVGAGVVTVGFAAVGVVFIGAWAIEEWDKGRNRKEAQAITRRAAR